MPVSLSSSGLSCNGCQCEEEHWLVAVMVVCSVMVLAKLSPRLFLIHRGRDIMKNGLGTRLGSSEQVYSYIMCQ